jgi:hypothetical protein
MVYEVTPHLKDLLFSLADYKVEVFTRVFNKYIENNFTREEALNICLKQSSEFNTLLEDIKLNYNKEK